MSDENNQELTNNYEQNIETNSEITKENLVDNKIQKDKNSGIVKTLLIILAVFLGVFAATYVVVDMSMHKLGIMPFVVTMEQAQKIFDKEAGFVEKNSPAPVKIEQNDKEAIVTVDLKKFDNNEDNINIKIEDNGIKIDGKVKKESKNGISESSFVQNVIFPNKFEKDKIQKNKKGNKLTITLPFED